METQRNEKLELTKKINPAMSFLKTGPVEVQAGYTDRITMDGEMAAMQYLVGEMEKAKP